MAWLSVGQRRSGTPQPPTWNQPLLPLLLHHPPPTLRLLLLALRPQEPPALPHKSTLRRVAKGLQKIRVHQKKSAKTSNISDGKAVSRRNEFCSSSYFWPEPWEGWCTPCARSTGT